MSHTSQRPNDGDPAGPLPICVLRAGDAVPSVASAHGEFFDWIRRAAGDAWNGPWYEHDLRSDGPCPPAARAAALVITGSSASVTERAPWMVRAEHYLREAEAAGVPMLGICFGHQLLAQALGGRVEKNPRGREIGTIELGVHEHDPLFEGLPQLITVNATHVDSVVVLPPGSRVVASTVLEQHAVVAFGPRSRGVQFHPEIDGAVMRGYVEARRSRLVDERLDAEAILAGCGDTPLGREVLRNFLRHFVASSARVMATAGRAA